MTIGSISSKELQNQAKYNSFIVCQTKKIPHSQKFPFIVTTLKGKITSQLESDDPYHQFQFNYSFDCVNYAINGKCVILSEGNWIKPILDSKQLNLLLNYEIINYEPLSIQNQVKFYYYHQKAKTFIQIIPKYLINQDCIVFQEIQQIQGIQFKLINLSQIQDIHKLMRTDRKLYENFIYCFRCEYGIMSDIHFMGSFVRDFKSIGSYLKKNKQKQYYHFIDQAILVTLKKLYPFSNL